MADLEAIGTDPAWYEDSYSMAFLGDIFPGAPSATLAGRVEMPWLTVTEDGIFVALDGEVAGVPNGPAPRARDHRA